MKNIFLSLVLIILIIGCTTNVDSQTSQDKGRVVFTITDAAADMGAVTSVKVKVESVKVHSEIEGWVDVTTTPQEYDLLQLKAENTQALLADVQLKYGEYNQLRLDISKVIVTDNTGEHEAKLPSGELKINGELTVKTNTTSTAVFDFILDESLHVTGNGQYILAPVIQLETRDDAEVEINDNNKVEIKSGKVKTNVKVGTDEKGNVGIGLGLAKDARIDIDTLGGLKLGLGRSEERRNENSANAEVKSDTSVNVNNNAEVDTSVNAGISY